MRTASGPQWGPFRRGGAHRTVRFWYVREHFCPPTRQCAAGGLVPCGDRLGRAIAPGDPLDNL
jgi:hypothetical protein